VDDVGHDSPGHSTPVAGTNRNGPLPLIMASLTCSSHCQTGRDRQYTLPKVLYLTLARLGRSAEQWASSVFHVVSTIAQVPGRF
jgi:hypothetical protein